MRRRRRTWPRRPPTTAARALASPASLKGILSASEAAAALAEGFARAGVEADALPIADGGEGTAELLGRAVGIRACVSTHVHDAFGRSRTATIRYLEEGSALVEAAEVIPLDPQRLDPFAASSRGLAELVASVGDCRRLLVCLGGTATVDGGAGFRELAGTLPAPTVVLCDVLVPLRDAARMFAAQKGARPEDVPMLEGRLAAIAELAPFAELPGAGAAGGLGAALAALGAELVSGAEFLLDAVGFRERVRGVELVVTGEGRVDATTTTGKAPGAALRSCRLEGIRCAVFGGSVDVHLEGVEVHELSGRPEHAREDLAALGARLGTTL